jgi:DNA-binding CsgD family transcriptional regulator
VDSRDAWEEHARGVTHAALAALERLHFGVLLLGPRSELRHANTRAYDIARRTQAFGVETSGRLQAFSPALSAKLHRAVHAACGGSGTHHGVTALRLRGSTGTEVHAFVVPAQPVGQQPPPSMPVAATMFVTDPAATVPIFARKLRQIYLLSPSEAQLAEALVHGKSLKTFAEERGTTLNTVRTQLKTMAAKVGAKRQVDVVRCILTGPALLDL